MEAVGGHEERHEIKFAAYATEYSRLRHWLQMHPAGFCSPYPKRQVNNVYFDTSDYRAYAENLAGVSARSKVRFRWYGSLPGPDSGSLEVKQKRNYFGWKLRFAVAEAPWHDGDSWSQVRSSLRNQLSAGGQLWLDHNPLPVMLNRYQREYFESADRRIRVTIDTHQQVYDQRIGASPNVNRPSIMQDTLVVEFKFAREHRPDAVKLLAKMPLRIGRHSKYMNAVRAIGLVG